MIFLIGMIGMRYWEKMGGRKIFLEKSVGNILSVSQEIFISSQFKISIPIFAKKNLLILKKHFWSHFSFSPLSENFSEKEFWHKKIFLNFLFVKFWKYFFFFQSKLIFLLNLDKVLNLLLSKRKLILRDFSRYFRILFFSKWFWIFHTLFSIKNKLTKT